jgi:hypothetical protein
MALTESFVEAVDSVPTDVHQQVLVGVPRQRDWRLAQERLDDLRMLALYEEV